VIRGLYNSNSFSKCLILNVNCTHGNEVYIHVHAVVFAGNKITPDQCTPSVDV